MIVTFFLKIIIGLLPLRLTGCPRNIPDFPVHVTITKYLTQSDKLLHGNQPITAMDVHNIIRHREFRFFIGLEGKWHFFCAGRPVEFSSAKWQQIFSQDTMICSKYSMTAGANMNLRVMTLKIYKKTSFNNSFTVCRSVCKVCYFHQERLFFGSSVLWCAETVTV